MARNTKMIQVGANEYLVCKSCGEEYEDLVLKEMLRVMMKRKADMTGLSPEFLMNLRKEQEEIRMEDEAKIDDEVDVMDAAKAKKIFRNNKDPYEQSKPPLQIMREKFMEGMRKTREKKIIVPGSVLSKPGKIILPSTFGRKK